MSNSPEFLEAIKIYTGIKICCDCGKGVPISHEAICRAGIAAAEYCMEYDLKRRLFGRKRRERFWKKVIAHLRLLKP